MKDCAGELRDLQDDAAQTAAATQKLLLSTGHRLRGPRKSILKQSSPFPAVSGTLKQARPLPPVTASPSVQKGPFSHNQVGAILESRRLLELLHLSQAYYFKSFEKCGRHVCKPDQNV